MQRVFRITFYPSRNQKLLHASFMKNSSPGLLSSYQIPIKTNQKATDFSALGFAQIFVRTSGMPFLSPHHQPFLNHYLFPLVICNKNKAIQE